jgi:glucuronate isomerase
MLIHEDRLFPADPSTRKIARALYEHVKSLPILSPHGHTQASWFAKNEPFPDPATLLVQPDHYVYRMLYSQGISMDDLEIGAPEIKNPRKVWRLFASHYFLFRGTPTRLWLDFVFQNLFGLQQRLSAETADLYFDTISEKLQTPEFLPRALFERFNIEVLTTTDSPLDSLDAIQAIRASGWKGRILPTFRPDSVVDPEFAGFAENIARLGEQAKEDTTTWTGYLNALRQARQRFKALGGTATDHGHLTAQTADLPKSEAEALFQKVLCGHSTLKEKVLFQAQMLTEMAQMSLEDGLVMQIHPGCVRNHNRKVYEKFGRDVGADIPQSTDYVHALRPLLDRFGNESSSPSFCSRWTKRPTVASWLRWPGTIRACGLAPPGGSMTAPRECVASASRPPKRRAFTIRSASTTTRAPSCPFRRGMMWRGASIAAFWPGWSPKSAWKKTKPLKWRTIWPTGWRKRPTGCRSTGEAWRTAPNPISR